MNDLRQISVHAGRAIGNHVPRELVVEINKPFPDFDGAGWQARQCALMDREARDLAEHLLWALPGGTFDRLVVDLLRRQLSLLVVSYEEPAPVAEGSAAP